MLSPNLDMIIVQVFLYLLDKHENETINKSMIDSSPYIFLDAKMLVILGLMIVPKVQSSKAHCRC